MGQTELVESRLDFFFVFFFFFNGTRLPSPTCLPPVKMKGPDNAAIFSSLMSSQASGMVSLFPEATATQQFSHHTTKTN